MVHAHWVGGYDGGGWDQRVNPLACESHNPQANELNHDHEDKDRPECSEQDLVSMANFNTALEFKPLSACHSTISGTGNNGDAVVA